MSKSKSRKKKAAQARSGAPRSRTRQDSRPEQPDVRQRRWIRETEIGHIGSGND